MTGGMKTPAGTDRVIPIHGKIRGMLRKYYDKAIALGCDYLFNCTDGQTHMGNIKMTYDKYANRFEAIRDELKLSPEHRAIEKI